VDQIQCRDSNALIIDKEWQARQEKDEKWKKLQEEYTRNSKTSLGDSKTCVPTRVSSLTIPAQWYNNINPDDLLKSTALPAN